MMKLKTGLRLARVALVAFVGFVITRQATAHISHVGTSEDSGSPLSGFGYPFFYVTYKNYLYTFLSNTSFFWNKASSLCIANGGELVTIETKQEQHALEVLLHGANSSNTHNLVWIGGAYNPTCGFWEWVYTYVLHKVFFKTEGHIRYNYGYTNWWRDEPHNTVGFCVAISLDLHNFGRWISTDCSDSHNLICQWNECQRWSWDPDHCVHQNGCWYNFLNNHCQRISEVPPLPPPPPPP